MKGMIWKDLLLMRSTGKSYLLMCAVFIALSFTKFYSISFVSGIFTMMIIMMPINTFAYDEQAKWDKYAAATPMGRAGIVKGKYGFTLVISLAGLLIITLLQALFFFVGVGVEPGDSLWGAVTSGVGAVGYGIMMNAVLLPLIFKFGTQKSRIFMIITVAVAVSSLVVAANMLESVGVNTQPLLLFFFGSVPVFAMLLLIPSYFLSLRIYQHKDL